ncbi:MAG: hypothetical protein KC506_04045, partial [Nanoarchaeota archaeon]|nr:hypothetical protein [Nanoarchaeota archaeon]
PNLDFFAQRKKCNDNGSFFLTPKQYFSLRLYAAHEDLEFDEILRKTRGYERFDQIIDASSNPVQVYTRPIVDFQSDTFEKSNGVNAPFILKIPFYAGFTFNHLDSETGLPSIWEDNYGKPRPGKNQNDTIRWEGYRVANPPNWKDIIKIYSKKDLQLNPMFRARDGMDYLFINPINNVKSAMDKFCVRECYLATEENVEKFKERIITP